MKIQDILAKVDHTLLSVTATKEEIRALCDDAMTYKTASVCVAPCYVSLAKAHTEGKMKISTFVKTRNKCQN